MIFSYFGIVIWLFAPMVGAQTLVERQQKIKLAVANRAYKSAAQELNEFRRIDAKIFEINNYDYLTARVAERQNDFATATANYQTVVKRNSVLRDYALWHLAQMMRANGNLTLERLLLQQLIIAAPDGLLTDAANFRRAQSFYESGDYEAVSSSKFQISNFKSKSKIQNRKWQVLLGQTALRMGDKERARQIFVDLETNLPNPSAPDDYALAAIRGLDELDAAKPEDVGKIAPVLPEAEHLRRAQIYQFNRDFDAARLYYQAIDEQFPNSQNLPFALLQRGRIDVQNDHFDRAIALFEQIQNQFPNDASARDALLFEAGAFVRSGDADAAVARYKNYIEKYVENNQNGDQVDQPERAYLNIIDALRDKGRDADALVWIQKTRQKFAGQLPAAQAQFSLARMHLAQQNWTATIGDLSDLETAPDLGGARVNGGTNRAETAFLKAFCLENLGRFDEAVNAYLAIADGRAEYYGGRATERLRNLSRADNAREIVQTRLNQFRLFASQAAANNEWERARQAAQNALRLTDNQEISRELLDVCRRAYAVLPSYKNPVNGELPEIGRQKLIEKPTANIAQNQHQQTADELLFLNLYDEAAPELETAQNPKTKDQRPKTNAFALAVLFKRGDLANRAVRFAEPLWRDVPNDYLLELAPREAVELLYPAPYTDFLLDSTAPRNVDARFALSIMRQESRYQADIKSDAAARGLMQFIPSTAAKIAAEINQPNFTPDDLYNPPTAILFGAQYLNNIFRQFPNQPQAVAAAYNGGETSTLRWLLRSRSTDADRYVCEIQLAQSKDYVYKVLANYRAYQTLYDERLQPK